MSTNTSWITPGKILAAIAVLAIAFAIFAPQQNEDPDIVLSSHSAGPNGARGLYEVLSRLGYPTRRITTRLNHPLDSNTTYVLLQPSTPLTAVEQNMLLDAVRHGATIIFTAQQRTLSDSLGFELRPALDRFRTIASTAVAGNDVRGQRSGRLPIPVPISTTVALQDDVHIEPTPFMWIADSLVGVRSPKPPVRALVLGRAFGSGHAIAVAPAAILTNQLLHDGRPAIAIVHALGWAGSSRPTGAVVFDEYHHGFGTHADLIGTVQYALTSTPLGRMTLQGLAAAIILILAVGARAIPPLPTTTISRRSPLEHVGALARAYLQVDSRALGADRLVRGLRRRHPLGVARSVPHHVYLAALRARIPAAATDVDVIAAQLEHDSNSSDGLATAGAAAANIERIFQG